MNHNVEIIKCYTEPGVTHKMLKGRGDMNAEPDTEREYLHQRGH